jgi:precorrin isomerase
LYVVSSINFDIAHILHFSRGSPKLSKQLKIRLITDYSIVRSCIVPQRPHQSKSIQSINARQSKATAQGASSQKHRLQSRRLPEKRRFNEERDAMNFQPKNVCTLFTSAVQRSDFEQ